MGLHIDFESASLPQHFIHRVPGPVRSLIATTHHDGRLVLHWEPPGGITRVDGYRITRTRDGHAYELLGETTALEFTVAAPEPGEPWFYRVVAHNLRGIGGARRVYFFRRAKRLRPGGRILPCVSLPVPIRPGLCVRISEGDRPE
jgi:hypothetical protein